MTNNRMRKHQLTVQPVSTTRIAQRTLPEATDLLIVGGGPAGIAAARTCQRLGVAYLLVEAGPRLGGQLLWTQSVIGDYLGVAGATGPELLRELIGPVDALFAHTDCTVSQLDVRSRRAALTPRAGQSAWVSYRHLLWVTGSKERRLGVPGEHHLGVHHGQFSLSQRAREFSGQDVVIVGGGDRALEGAVTCAKAGATVAVLNRSARLRASKAFADAAGCHASVKLERDTVVDRIERLTTVSTRSPLQVRAHRAGTGQSLVFPCDAVVIRIGVEPQTELVRDVLDCREDGTIVVDKFGRTSDAHILAAGDVTMPAWACGLQTALGQGVLAARCAVNDLC